jgi:hypothetical protein
MLQDSPLYNIAENGDLTLYTQRTGQSGKDVWWRTGTKGQPGQDSHDRAAREVQPGQYSQNSIQPGHDSQAITAATGQQDKSVLTGQPGQES